MTSVQDTLLETFLDEKINYYSESLKTILFTEKTMKLYRRELESFQKYKQELEDLKRKVRVLQSQISAFNDLRF